MTTQSKAEIQVVCVPPDLFGRVWEHAGEWILRGMAEADDVPVLSTIDRCRNGRVQLWLILRGKELLGTFLTQIARDEDGSRWVVVFCLAGKDIAPAVRAMTERMDAFARAEGAKGTRCYGRRAWKRMIPGVKIVGKVRPGVLEFERAA